MSRLTFTSSRIEAPDQEPEYWLSFSDLMAGLVMIFALMILAALHNYQKGIEEMRCVLDPRTEVIDSLRDKFKNDTLVTVEADGSVLFGESVLFSQSSAVVLPEGRMQLASFANRYASVILGNPAFEEQLRALVIEGHTNSDGSYELNLDLSQKRAFAVMMVLLEEAGENRAVMEKLVSANGRSYSDLLYEDEGQTVEDKERSRRIEIHFRLNDAEILTRILDGVPGGCTNQADSVHFVTYYENRQLQEKGTYVEQRDDGP